MVFISMFHNKICFFHNSSTMVNRKVLCASPVYFPASRKCPNFQLNFLTIQTPIPYWNHNWYKIFKEKVLMISKSCFYRGSFTLVFVRTSKWSWTVRHSEQWISDFFFFLHRRKTKNLTSTKKQNKNKKRKIQSYELHTGDFRILPEYS